MIYHGISLPDEPGILAAYQDEQGIRDAYWHPQPGEAVLDLGAGIGSYALPALLAGASVIAIDPDTVATGKLARVAEMNGCAALVIRNCGVWESAAYPPEMYQALVNSEYSYLIPAPGTVFVTLDDLASPLTRLDWVKIDVEGAELGVLRSGLASIGRLRPRLIVELHDEVYPYVRQIGSALQCRVLLEGLGYKTEAVPYGPPSRSYLICEP